MLRHVGATHATVWVQTAAPATVEVLTEGRTHRARTFGVHGFHYALVVVDGLQPGTAVTYEVRVDGSVVWPQPGSTMPPSRIATWKVKA